MLKNISGFPEFLPKEQMAFNAVVDTIKKQFELHGFAPLDTPAVERISTLRAKGNDHEIYGIYRLAQEQGEKDKDLALRFDLTVPLARYVAQHYTKLTFPYRRYHIAPVWRGERPQAGRYRQFYQCDIDIIGDKTLSLVYDAEALSVIYSVLRSLRLERFIILINHRALLTGLLTSLGICQRNLAPVLRVLDKAEKISQETFMKELEYYGMSPENIGLLTRFILQRFNTKECIEYLFTLCTTLEFVTGLKALQEVLSILKDFEVPDCYLRIDPLLTRGLTYYTGIICEIKLLDYPELGSVCGGGRYSNLVENFSKHSLPGVGFSIGISRLIPKLIDTGAIQVHQETPAMVLVTTQAVQCIPYYIKIAKRLRIQGINTEIYLASNPLGVQIKYASKKGIPFVIIANQEELERKQVILRELKKGQQRCIALDHIWEALHHS